jgi:RNA polymerase sigma factor (TIGR02999 family)
VRKFNGLPRDLDGPHRKGPSRLGSFLDKGHLLIRRVPSPALDPGKHFYSISIVVRGSMLGRTGRHILGLSFVSHGESMPEDLSEARPPQPRDGAIDIAALSAEVYQDLRGLARARLRSSGPLTLLDTSDLVGDTYRRLALQHDLKIESRGQFLGYCSRIMRSVIIDMIRERNAGRRGGGVPNITLNTELGESLAHRADPLRIDETLEELAKQEPRLAQVVEMRYFGGYSEEEVAEALGITARTVQRDWQKARMLLQAMLSDID